MQAIPRKSENVGPKNLHSTIFLFGPPGAGKTTLGEQVCAELNLGFGEIQAQDACSFEDIKNLFASQEAEVVEVPWVMQLEKGVFELARKTGVTLALWAHPEDMLARAGLPLEFLHASSRITTKSGFGLCGGGCLEFRRLKRGCTDVVDLVHLSLPKACEALKRTIVTYRNMDSLSPIKRAGIAHWEEIWCEDYPEGKAAVKTVVEAMAEYVLHLREQGISPRSLSAVLSDLNVAGLLVFRDYDFSERNILSEFSTAPEVFSFSRRISDSSTLVRRYERNLNGFASFLKTRKTSRKTAVDTEPFRTRPTAQAPKRHS